MYARASEKVTDRSTYIRFPLKARFAIRQIKGDFILHDRRSDTVHRLNSVAAVIWQLCDGTKERSAIVSEVASIFSKSPSEVAADIDEILARFTDAGLIHSTGSPAEINLLLRCVRIALGTDGAEGIAQQLKDPVDWVYIEQTAYQHGVMPLMFRGLRAIQKDCGVPADVLRRLEHAFTVNAARNTYLFRELIGLLALFEANDIPALPFKGPALAMWLYGDTAMRQSGDLDVLVPEEHVGRAKSLLAARGCHFRLPTNDSVLAEYDSQSHTVGVDLQWRFAPKWYVCPIDSGQLWSRVERMPVGAATMLRPTPEDHIRILSAHAAKHCWSKLGWIVDIATIIQLHHGTLDWHHVTAQSRQLGGERLVLLGARLAADVLGTALPPALMSAMQADAAVGSLATELRLRLFAPVKDPNSVRGSYNEVDGGLLYIRTRERLRDKLPYVWHLLGHPFRRLASLARPNRHDRAIVTLSGSFAHLYYLVRPARLTAIYLAGLMSRFYYLRR
jgi:hypothetical protein